MTRKELFIVVVVAALTMAGPKALEAAHVSALSPRQELSLDGPSWNVWLDQKAL